MVEFRFIAIYLDIGLDLLNDGLEITRWKVESSFGTSVLDSFNTTSSLEFGSTFRIAD